MSDSLQPFGLYVTHQAPLSMGFSRQEVWSGLLCPPPGDLPDPGIEPMSPALQVASLPLSYQGSARARARERERERETETVTSFASLQISKPSSVLGQNHSSGPDLQVLTDTGFGALYRHARWETAQNEGPLPGSCWDQG